MYGFSFDFHLKRKYKWQKLSYERFNDVNRITAWVKPEIVILESCLLLFIEGGCDWWCDVLCVDLRDLESSNNGFKNHKDRR